MIYLDSAAVVKLVHAEPESGALRRWLGERAETGRISSVLTEIEAFRALARYAPGAVSRLPAVLDQIDLIDLDPRIRILAQAVEPATVRSLDAVHLGAALQSRPGLTSFVTYDKRLLDAAQTAGLPLDFARLTVTGGTATEPSSGSGWLVGPPALAASAGHDAWSAAPWTRGFTYPCAEAPQSPERGRRGRGRRTRPRGADRGS
jgi:hypothetical protein